MKNRSGEPVRVRILDEGIHAADEVFEATLMRPIRLPFEQAIQRDSLTCP